MTIADRNLKCPQSNVKNLQDHNVGKMPNLIQVANEIIQESQKGSENPIDVVREKYIAQLHKLTNRNVIIYYSGWLQKGRDFSENPDLFVLGDLDMHAFMTMTHELDRALGLDLILHTPGGDAAATESLINYLRQMFGDNIRAIVPHLAMSGGTMICMAAKEVVMGKESSLGPYDPQFGPWPAAGILSEFEQAADDMQKRPWTAPLWREIISKYPPTFIGLCEQAGKWAEECVSEWLRTGMFKELPTAEIDQKIKNVTGLLGSHKESRSHGRHFPIDKIKKIGINVTPLEADSDFQDIVLSIHHACMITLANMPISKIVSNNIQRNYVTVVESLNPTQTQNAPQEEKN